MTRNHSQRRQPAVRLLKTLLAFGSRDTRPTHWQAVPITAINLDVVILRERGDGQVASVNFD